MRERAELVRRLEAEGWTVTKARNGHLHCVAPNGARVQISSTPSDRRGALNDAVRLKRAALHGGDRWAKKEVDIVPTG